MDEMGERELPKVERGDKEEGIKPWDDTAREVRLKSDHPHLHPHPHPHPHPNPHPHPSPHPHPNPTPHPHPNPDQLHLKSGVRSHFRMLQPSASRVEELAAP